MKKDVESKNSFPNKFVMEWIYSMGFPCTLCVINMMNKQETCKCKVGESK